MTMVEQPGSDWQCKRAARYTGYAADIQGTTAGAVSNGLISGGTTPINADLKPGACLQLCAGSTTTSNLKNLTTSTNIDPNDGEAVGQPTSGWRTPFVFVTEDWPKYDQDKVNNQAGVTANLRDGGRVPVVSGVQTCKVLVRGTVYAGQTLLEPVSGQFYLQPASVRGSNLVYSTTARGAQSAANSSTETAFDAYATLPANSLNVGDIIKIRAQGIAPTTVGSDTLTIKAYIHTATSLIAGTLLGTGPAIDVANNDIFTVDILIQIRTIGASGTLVSEGYIATGTPGTATARAVSSASATVNTTAAQYVGISATWNSTNNNIVYMDILAVEKVAASSLGLGPVAVAMETPSSQPTSTAALVKVKLLDPPR